MSRTMSPNRIDFRYLSEEDMITAGVTDMAACIDVMAEAFTLLHSGDYRMAGANGDSHGAMIGFPETSAFPSMPKPTPDRRFMAMPAYLGGRFGTTGVKWYGSNIDNRQHGLPRSILMFMLNDTETGAPLALMSANLLSAYRTGAIPGLAARYFARKEARTLAIMGPGVMARTSLVAFLTQCPHIDTVKILGRGRASIDAFTAWLRRDHPQITQIVEVTGIEDLVRDSDIVTYCTSGASGDPATYPLVRRDWVKSGALLVMPAKCNMDAGMEAPEIRKVVDILGMYDAWAEETPRPLHQHIGVIGCRFLDMVEAGIMARAEIEDMCAIAAGAAPGRRTEEEIVIVSVGGIPVEDVAWGTQIYQNACARGIGTLLNLWNSPALA